MSGSTLAKRLGITLQRVDKVIRNSYVKEDNIESDHEYVNREVAAEILRKASRTFPPRHDQRFTGVSLGPGSWPSNSIPTNSQG